MSQPWFFRLAFYKERLRQQYGLLTRISDLVTRTWSLRSRTSSFGRALDASVVPPLPGQRGPAAASVLAYNLGNLWRRLVLPARIDTWSLTSLQQRLAKTGGRLVKHAGGCFDARSIRG